MKIEKRTDWHKLPNLVPSKMFPFTLMR